MNDGFSFNSSITFFELFQVSWVNLGYIAGDRRQNLKPKFAQVPEQSDSTYGGYLVAAEHLSGLTRCSTDAHHGAVLLGPDHLAIHMYSG